MARSPFRKEESVRLTDHELKQLVAKYQKPRQDTPKPNLYPGIREDVLNNWTTITAAAQAIGVGRTCLSKWLHQMYVPRKKIPLITFLLEHTIYEFKSPEL